MIVKRLATFFLMLTTILLSFPACESEPENVEEHLIGRWEIVNATRDGRPAETLSDLYYEFNADGSMLTNLPVGEAESTYEIDGSTLTQKTAQMDVEYRIESITDSTLVLTATIRDTPFRFNLQKNPSPVN